MNEDLPVSYQEVNQELASAGSDMSAAEMHGLMAGWLCQHDVQDKSWRKQLFPEMVVTDLIEQMFYGVAEQLESDDFIFELLLPEEAEINEYGSALADWCSAFLSGIGLAKVKKPQSPDLQEGFQDLVEITKLDYSSLESTEENEVALTELSEFVKTVVMMAYWEMKEKQSKDALH